MRKRSDSRRSIVFFSAQDYWYHNRGHSDVQLTRGMARDRTVLLVNSIGMRMPTPGKTTQPLRRIARKATSILRFVRRPEPALPGLIVMSPVFLPAYGARGRQLNALLVGAQVRAAMWLLRLSLPDVIVTIPTAADVVERLPHRSLTVNRADKFSAFTEANQPVIAALERRLLTEADVILYVSHMLMDEERDFAHGTVYFLGHGVEVDHFSPPPDSPVPGDLADLPRPIVGFFGGLDEYLVDFDLIRKTADAMTEGTLVLIGDPTCDISHLLTHPRIRWLGPRDYGELPAYGAAFDVSIMPWLDNEWIKYCNPIKAKEYLALGAPVVTTYYPEAVPFASVMAIARTSDDFVDQVVAAARGGGTGTKEARRGAVRVDSWLAKSRELLGLIDRVSV